jgi:hypothetical protein
MFGGVAEWLTRRTSNLMIAGRLYSNPVRWLNKQLTLHTLSSIKRIRGCFNTLIASKKIEPK